MRPVDFPGQNKVFNAKGCGNLPAYNDGQQTVTCWEMDREDFDKFLGGEKIYLSVLAGDSTPPVQIFIGPPPFLMDIQKDIDKDTDKG